jgi:cytoskeletal protein CcmA (bactofilin family)
MPAIKKQDQVLVACPHCGHEQSEPRTGISTVCKECRKHFNVHEALNPTPKAEKWKPEVRRVTCFECGTELEVPVNAESTMCKRCSRHLDLRDYHITNAVSKNFRTRGAFFIEPKGNLFNTETFAGEVVIKGRFLGKLVAERSLTIYSTAEIKGTFEMGQLIIPAENHFRWPQPIKTGSAEIAGELVADLHANQTIVLKSTARMFGDLTARNVVVEAGAVLVGQMRIGSTMLL